MLHVFGGSWGYGSELKQHEKPFAYYLGLRLNEPVTNHAKEGRSLGHIFQNVLSNIDNIHKDDYVVVLIPPDVRWYTISDNFNFRSLSLSDKEYQKLIKYYNVPWFQYHHNLFIYNIITIVTSKTTKLIMAHDYGNLVIIDLFKNLIDKKYLLSELSLTKLLVGDDWKNNYNLETDGPEDEIFKGKYFEGNINHPNQKGHMEIARLIYDKFNKK